MARPKKPVDELHDNQVNLNLTTKQKVAIQALADLKDVPFQVALRALVVTSLDSVIVNMGVTIPNNLHH